MAQNFGKKGAKLKIKISGERVFITKARAVGDFTDPEDETNPVDTLTQEETFSTVFSWHAGLTDNQTELIEKIVEKTINEI